MYLGKNIGGMELVGDEMVGDWVGEVNSINEVDEYNINICNGMYMVVNVVVKLEIGYVVEWIW